MNKEVKQALAHLKIMTKDDKNCELAIELIENELKEDEEWEQELIAEQHRLFDLAKEQENELQKYKENERFERLKFKALGDGFYCRLEDEFGNLGKPRFCKPEDIRAGRSCFYILKRKYTREGHFYETVESVPYNMHGKIWALTKEELEK